MPALAAMIMLRESSQTVFVMSVTDDMTLNSEDMAKLIPGLVIYGGKGDNAQSVTQEV